MQPDRKLLSPGKCRVDEIQEFFAVIRLTGEVQEAGLVDRIKRAELLAIQRNANKIVGIVALKVPDKGYRQHVEASAEFDLPEAKYPYELGWAYVDPSVRQQQIASTLCTALIADRSTACIFATTRTNNAGMQRVLEKVGFQKVGKSYQSKRGDHTLMLYVLDR